MCTDTILFVPKFSFLYSREQKTLQALLRRLRVDANLRQEDVAARLNVYQTMVSKVESGERQLTLPELRAYIGAVGIDLPRFVALYEEDLKQGQE